MKKFMLLMTLMLLLGAFALPAAAVPISDLTTLAAYFPESSLLFASARTDDDFVTTLDGLLTQAGQAMPELGSVTLVEALDSLASDIKDGATFQQLFRAWLGDTAAVGFLPPAPTDQYDSLIVVVALSITDRDAAEAFFQSITRPRDYAQTVGADFTAYEHIRGNTHLVFRDDVILMSSDFASIENGGVVEAPLSGVEAFNSTLDLLPQDDYNAVTYVDTPALVTLVNEMSAASGGMPMTLQVAGLGLNAVTAQALGLTIVDGNSLTIDAVTGMGADAVLPGAITDPLDLTLLERIPAGTPLVILGSNFSDSFNMIEAQIEQFASMPEMEFENSTDDVGIALWMLDFFVRGFTGMNFRAEILPAFNGTYALYAGVNPAAEGAANATELITPDLLLDFALTLQTTDAAVAAELRRTLSATLHALPAERQDNLTLSFEEVNGTEVTVLGVETNPFSGDQIEFLLAVSDEVFTFGTRRYVEAALNPGVGLDQDAQWQEAAQYFVPGSYNVLYQSSDNLVTLGDVLARTPMNDASDAGRVISILTELISSSSISYGTLAGGGVQMRAVLTLNAE